MQRAHRRSTPGAVTFIVWLAVSAGALAQDGQLPPSAATLTVWNHPIAVLRAPYDGVQPEGRAESAELRIESLPVDAASLPITTELVTATSGSGVVVRVGPHVAFALFRGDVDPGIDLQQAAVEAGARLQEALRARASQHRWDVVLRGTAMMLAAGLVALGLLFAVRRLRHYAQGPIERLVSRVEQRVTWMHPELGARIVSLLHTALDLSMWTIRLLIVLLWVVFALMQFPLFRPIGFRLAERVATLLTNLGTGVVHALPGLFIATMIFAGARALVQLVGVAFGLVSSGVVQVRWLHADTARATQQLVVVFVWAAAILAAYPYIPGSETDAFKGLTLLFGVIASLGSAGLAGQAMSGLSAVYSRILRQGEYVRIGETEGQVLSVGLLATKLHTPGREEITIPSSVLMSSSTINYSRLCPGATAVSTSVGIGYDAPWRQVEGLLMLAAGRTAGLAPEPPPRVMQRQLRSFDIEYVLLAFVSAGQSRPLVLSSLNANVLDAFNEFGVQIMTPSFESQPEQEIVVPRSRWFDAPAASPVPFRERRHGDRVATRQSDR